MAESGSNQNQDAGPLSASSSRSEDSVEGRVKHILVADDSRADAFVICEALRKSGVAAQIHVARDGEETMRFLDAADADASAPCPDLILLDINMPRYKGSDVLRHLRASQRCAKSLVLIVTSSDSQEDREEMERLGANGYFRKPSALAEMLKLGQRVRELLAMSEPGGSA